MGATSQGHHVAFEIMGGRCDPSQGHHSLINVAMLGTSPTRYLPHVGATIPQYVTIVRGCVCACHHERFGEPASLHVMIWVTMPGVLGIASCDELGNLKEGVSGITRDDLDHLCKELRAGGRSCFLLPRRSQGAAKKKQKSRIHICIHALASCAHCSGTGQGRDE